MDKLKRRGLVRLMTYCLARRPDEFGLVPDPAGFLPLKQLSRALSEEPGWGFLRESHLREMAYEGPFDIDGQQRIRSTDEGRLAGFFQPANSEALPAILYHAGRRRAYPVILQRGLVSSEARPVIMSTTPELALKVGRRRDHEPVLIEVRAAEAALAGVEITQAGELLYVAESVPAQFLLGPPVEKVPMPRRQPKPSEEEAAAPELPGSFFPRLTPPLGEPRAPRSRRERDKPDWKRERRRDRRRHNRDEDW